jgi:hypothetical protein
MDGGPETVIVRVENGVKVKWPDHYTILLGAGGVGFTKEGKMLNLPLIWAGYEDKRLVNGIEAIEFYLSWPERFGKDCYFVMFSFNYDVTMLLKGLRQGRSKNWHYDRVWEICKRKDKDTGKVLNHAARTSFAPDAFELNKIGIVSLSPAVARDMAALALRVASISECGKSVRRVLSWL